MRTLPIALVCTGALWTSAAQAETPKASARPAPSAGKPAPAPASRPPTPVEQVPTKPVATSTAPAAKSEASASTGALAPHGVLLAARVGPTFPQPFNALKTSVLAELQGAYQLPWRDRALGITFGLGYTQPGLEGSRVDPRVTVNEGKVDYALAVRDFSFTLGAQYLLQLPQKIVGYAGLGVRMHLTRSVLTQHAGAADLGETTEDATRFGPVVRVGAGYPVGPGLVSLELSSQWAGINQRLTGLANTSDLALQAGYILGL